MRDAQEIAMVHVRQCDPPDRCEGWPKTDYCVCERRTEWLADIIRAAQIDAAKWMRDEAAKWHLRECLRLQGQAKAAQTKRTASECQRLADFHADSASSIRSIKLPGVEG